MSEADNGQPAPQPILTETGEFSPNWTERYDESMRPTLSRFKTFDDFVNSHVSLRQKLGKNPDALVEIPGDDADPETKKAFARRLGVPETPDKYEYEVAPEIKKVVGDVDAEQMGAFKKFAHEELELPPAKFKKLMDYYFKLNADGVSKFSELHDAKEKETYEQSVAALKKEWGNAYDEKVERAQLFLEKYGGNELVTKKGLHNDVDFIKWADSVASDLSEDRIKGLNKTSALTPSQADAKIAELRAHPAYLDKRHPEHKRVREETRQLYAKRTA